MCIARAALSFFTSQGRTISDASPSGAPAWSEETPDNVLLGFHPVSARSFSDLMSTRFGRASEAAWLSRRRAS